MLHVQGVAVWFPLTERQSIIIKPVTPTKNKQLTRWRRWSLKLWVAGITWTFHRMDISMKFNESGIVIVWKVWKLMESADNDVKWLILLHCILKCQANMQQNSVVCVVFFFLFISFSQNVDVTYLQYHIQTCSDSLPWKSNQPNYSCSASVLWHFDVAHSVKSQTPAVCKVFTKHSQFGSVLHFSH